MATTGQGPHVAHCPDHRLGYLAQGAHADQTVDPVQVHDVRRRIGRVAGAIKTGKTCAENNPSRSAHQRAQSAFRAQTKRLSGLSVVGRGKNAMY